MIMNKKILVTGSSGHLGAALVITLRQRGFDVISIDIKPSNTTDIVGSITDKKFINSCMRDVDSVIHTATLHKPHIVTHSYEKFIETNVLGTLNILKLSKLMNVKSFIYVSTTSTFGDALIPDKGLPAAYIDESTNTIPKNIYGVTKQSAEDLCQIFHRNYNLPCLVLKLSRFFQEEDDCRIARKNFDSDNLKANEYLYRRVDIQDAVEAIILAMEKAPRKKFNRYIISANSPFSKDDMAMLRINAPSVVEKYFPEYVEIYKDFNWKMNSIIDRVYINTKAREELGWSPVFDFKHVLTSLKLGKNFRSPLALEIGSKGYHDEIFEDGPYPVFEYTIQPPHIEEIDGYV
ncbi:NAD-dependent epimerase/dehydratase family protein [Xenorhabdus thuongxuanensis]|uniref:NAD dependent epimerase n=3 Tax=Xenorhabdus thuongxuanensis TaxID=1873484 RepID=A0A1Q5U154_9GAMM|nr:NAD(P)-dependent oxidoreductase [Xenorhabdus thuongxuanensis]OKP06220.1 NAD dependent epimerase [Xenorhabdus thuongxuanensis]